MAKPTLGAALRRTANVAGPRLSNSCRQPQPHPEPQAAQRVQPSRQGKAPITAFFDPAVRQQLKILAAEQNKTVEEMLARALNLLFA
jgi:hypothetical protein